MSKDDQAAFEAAAKSVMAKFLKLSKDDQKSILRTGGTAAMIAKIKNIKVKP